MHQTSVKCFFRALRLATQTWDSICYSPPGTRVLPHFSEKRNFLVPAIHWFGIRPIEKPVSGKKRKSLTVRPNGALGGMKTCLYSWTRAHYNNTACLNLLLKLSWKENILNIKKRNLVTNLPRPSSQSSIASHCPSFILFTQ